MAPVSPGRGRRRLLRHPGTPRAPSHPSLLPCPQGVVNTFAGLSRFSARVGGGSDPGVTDVTWFGGSGIPSPQVLAKMKSKGFPQLSQPLLPCRTCSFLCLGVHVELLSKGLPGFQECCPIQGLPILFKHSCSSLASLPGREKQRGPGWPGQCPEPWHAREADPSRKAGKSLCLASFDLD